MNNIAEIFNYLIELQAMRENKFFHFRIVEWLMVKIFRIKPEGEVQEKDLKGALQKMLFKTRITKSILKEIIREWLDTNQKHVLQIIAVKLPQQQDLQVVLELFLDNNKYLKPLHLQQQFLILLLNIEQ